LDIILQSAYGGINQMVVGKMTNEHKLVVKEDLIQKI
jgi:hypothetical protein